MHGDRQSPCRPGAEGTAAGAQVLDAGRPGLTSQRQHRLGVRPAESDLNFLVLGFRFRKVTASLPLHCGEGALVTAG